MKILAHRGYWNDRIESNSLDALRTALEKGYGIESDVRDYCNNIVISHEIANEKCPSVELIFNWLRELEDKYTFAINIKSDGLKNYLFNSINNFDIKNYFLFDMSVPQMVEYRDLGLRFFTRQSEIEINPCMYNDAAGVWIDGFWSTKWITVDLIKYHLNNNKEICLVSPELHKNLDYRKFWEKLKKLNLYTDNIMLCTDYPDDAKEYFDE